MWVIYFAETMQPLWTGENAADLAVQCMELNSKYGDQAYVVSAYEQPQGAK